MLKISELKTKTKTDRLGKNRQVSLTIKRAWLEIELDTCIYIYIYEVKRRSSTYRILRDIPTNTALAYVSAGQQPKFITP